MPSLTTKISLRKAPPASLAGIIGLALLLPLSVGAAGLKPALNDLTESLNFLIAVKRSDQDTAEKIKLEVIARQTTFNKIIDLAFAEISTLKNKAEVLLPEEERNLYLPDLEAFLNYHEALRNQVNRDLDLEELIAVGKQFRLWRETTYQTKINQLLARLLTFHNQKIVALADNRLEKIKGDLRLIKEILTAEQWQGFHDLLNKAETVIAKAAKSAETEPEKVSEKIKKAYSYFLEMSKLVRK